MFFKLISEAFDIEVKEDAMFFIHIYSLVDKISISELHQIVQIVFQNFKIEVSGQISPKCAWVLGWSMVDFLHAIGATYPNSPKPESLKYPQVYTYSLLLLCLEYLVLTASGCRNMKAKSEVQFTVLEHASRPSSVGLPDTIALCGFLPSSFLPLPLLVLPKGTY